MAELLRRERDKRNHKQTAVAEVVGMDQRTLSKWESGDIPEALIWFRNLANYYGVSADYLLGTKAPHLSSEEQAAIELLAQMPAAEWGEPWKTRSGKTARSKRASAKRDKAVILVLLDTGVRASELCDLEIRDYEPDSGQLYIRQGKGNKRRVVYLGQRARLHVWRYLADRQDARPSDPLFASRTGTRLDRNNLRHMLNTVARQAKINDVHPHRFRHTFAITFLRNGGNTFALQKLLGHEELSTVLKYVKLAETDIRAAQAAASVVDNWRL